MDDQKAEEVGVNLHPEQGHAVPLLGYSFLYLIPNPSSSN